MAVLKPNKGAGRGKTPAKRTPRGETEYVSQPMMAAAANIKDISVGKEIGTRAVTSAFRIDHAQEIVALEMRAEWQKDQLDARRSELKQVEKELVETPERVPACQVNAGGRGERDELIEVPFAEWQRRHQLNFLFGFVALFAVLVTSFLSVQASLEESGLPIFISQPVLPWFMAAIAPTASIALKSMHSIFRRDFGSKCFRWSIYGAMTISIFIWVFLFADRFEGLSGEFDPFSEPDAMSGWAFTVVQVITEVLVGTVLFLYVDSISACYSPSYTYSNLVHEDLTAREKFLRKQIKQLEKSVRDARGRLGHLDALHDFNVTAGELDVDQRRLRFEGTGQS